MIRITILMLFFSTILVAEPPMYNDFVYVECAGQAIRVTGGHADPCVADWDYDGLKDLLLGEFTYGRIRFYKNVNSNSNPQFNSWSYLQADGAIIQLPYG
jgi:hypothetical protein